MSEQLEEKPQEIPAPVSSYPWMQGKDAFLACDPLTLPPGLRKAYAKHKKAGGRK